MDNYDIMTVIYDCCDMDTIRNIMISCQLYHNIYKAYISKKVVTLHNMASDSELLDLITTYNYRIILYDVGKRILHDPVIEKIYAVIGDFNIKRRHKIPYKNLDEANLYTKGVLNDLSSYPAISKLRIHNIAFVDPTIFTNNITSVSFDNSRVLEYHHLTNVTSLDLGNAYSRSHDLRKMTSLMYLKYTAIDYGVIIHAPNITSLDIKILRNTNILCMPHLTVLSCLKSLAVNHNGYIDDSFFQDLHKLTNLTSIHLHNIKNTDFVPNLPNIISLVIRLPYCRERMIIPYTSSTIKTLHMLDGCYIPLTSCAIYLLHITTLCITGGKVSDFDRICDLVNLTTLVITNSEIIGSLDALYALDHVEYVDLQGTSATNYFTKIRTTITTLGLSSSYLENINTLNTSHIHTLMLQSTGEDRITRQLINIIGNKRKKIELLQYRINNLITTIQCDVLICRSCKIQHEIEISIIAKAIHTLCLQNKFIKSYFISSYNI